MKICLVEDDLELGRSLHALLSEGGHELVWVRRLVDAQQQLLERRFSALVLDLGLPDGCGLALLLKLRQQDPQLPVIVITARDGIEDRLEGLDSGADDYLVKPFASAELLARLRALARRSGLQGSHDEPLAWQARDLSLDEGRMALTRGNQAINLSRTEFSILLTLIKRSGHVVTRRELEAQALPHSDSHALDVHIFNLRKKIGDGYVRTVRGVGFVLEAA
ncbi:response regulator transcription factor [Paucibacter sp. PLA-PC-4]|uniref:response regulator n=1 Tax=Paucibacter sp. PLA-PC-4 TaxID=2993655 RepID=UPI002248B09C|nr:response regulator transcription factor [Paucibacter sp. PLA-PC-4]MCX2862891.1 response regulator transcription factor [Paucibacter sp. PLA-PC-4]